MVTKTKTTKKTVLELKDAYKAAFDAWNATAPEPEDARTAAFVAWKVAYTAYYNAVAERTEKAWQVRPWA